MGLLQAFLSIVRFCCFLSPPGKQIFSSLSEEEMNEESYSDFQAMIDHFSQQIFSLFACMGIEYSYDTNTDMEVMILVRTHTQYTLLTFFPRWGYSVLAT